MTENDYVNIKDLDTFKRGVIIKTNKNLTIRNITEWTSKEGIKIYICLCNEINEFISFNKNSLDKALKNIDILK